MKKLSLIIASGVAAVTALLGCVESPAIAGTGSVCLTLLCTNKQPLLNSVSAKSVVAYSLRELSSSYNGPSINVRRSSDNSTLDIGFRSGNLDIGSLLSFVGAGNSGFVTKWYDQSGNGNNEVQATTSSQPQIVNSGALYIIKGKVTVYFSGTKVLSNSPLAIFPTAFTINFVAEVLTDSAINMVASKVSGNVADPFDFWSTSQPAGTMYVGNGTVGTGFQINSGYLNATTGEGIWTLQSSSAVNSLFGWQNGNNILNALSPPTYGDTGVSMNIGQRADAATVLNGYVFEVLGFPSTISTSDRKIIEHSQENYYSISGQ